MEGVKKAMIDISKFIPSKRSKDEAYKMGFDCAVNGSNTINCHFSLFSARENTKAWEEGKRDGAKAKNNGKQ